MAPVVDRNSDLESVCQHMTCSVHKPLRSLMNNANPFRVMLDDLNIAFNRSNDKLDIDEVWRILMSYKSNPRDWSQWAHYDALLYKRSLIEEFRQYNVMILGWGPNVKSSIHNHPDSHCFMKVLDGELAESRYGWPQDNEPNQTAMKLMSREVMKTDDVLYIHVLTEVYPMTTIDRADKVGLHCVENPNPTRCSTSLHIYIPPFRECKLFDQATGKSQTCTMKFYSRMGKIVREDELC